MGNAHFPTFTGLDVRISRETIYRTSIYESPGGAEQRIAWYATPRGRWIGETEYRLASRCLQARPGDSLLDVGCGTGWFSRRAAADHLDVTGLDPNADWLDYARAHSSPALNWVAGDARALPFADASFDHVLSIAALYFVDDERLAVAESVRVAREANGRIKCEGGRPPPGKKRSLLWRASGQCGADGGPAELMVVGFAFERQGRHP